MRNFITYKTDSPVTFIKKLLQWSRDFKRVAVLNSNRQFNKQYKYYPDCNHNIIAATGSLDEYTSGISCSQNGSSLFSLQNFIDKKADWLFGHLNYDLKNEIEGLKSNNPYIIGFPTLSFFVPELIFITDKKSIRIGYRTESRSENEISSIFNEILSTPAPGGGTSFSGKVKNLLSKQDYLESVNNIKSHIKRGDIYEVNFCQEFISEETTLNPVKTWLNLINESPMPFSCYYRLNDKHLMCASPERFLKKAGNKIISQPIKGTYPRGRDIYEDQKLLQKFRTDTKERSENIMITDLVRNDLSRIALNPTVKVDELCEVFPFRGLFQMQSTISARVAGSVTFKDIIGATFPMGSMTGAPKVSAMELIERYETIRRGLYSGSVGYITPGGDFDLNVVIRSIQYNESIGAMSYITGGAITWLSVPENEYNECMLKANAIMSILDKKSVGQVPGD